MKLALRKLWAWKWKLFLGGFFIGFLLLLAAPSLISKKQFYEPFIRSLARDQFLLEIDRVQAGWFRPIEVSGVVVSDLAPESSKDAATAHLLTIKNLRTDRSLIGYLLGGRKLGRIEIIEPKIELSLLEDSSNLQRLIESIERAQNRGRGGDEGTKKPQAPPKLDLELAVRSATVQVAQQGNQKPLVVVPPFDVTAEYRASEQSPTLIVHPTTLLREVELTQELVLLGIGKALPLLAKSAWFDGNISLECEEITIPLDHPIDSVGKTRITLHQVRTGPSEPLLVDAIELLARLRNKSPEMELVFVDGSVVEVALENQRVTHAGLEAGLPKVDERLQFSSSGSVGLVDRTLDLTLLVPVPVEQLARRDVVKELGVPRLRVPVAGTLDQPKIDLSLMREDSGLVLGMMAEQLKKGEAPVLGSVVDSLGGVAKGDADEAIDAAIDLVKSIRDARRQANEAKKNESKDPSPTPERNPPRKRPVLDALRRAVQGE